MHELKSSVLNFNTLKKNQVPTRIELKRRKTIFVSPVKFHFCSLLSIEGR
jgi:hypothetical protein